MSMTSRYLTSPHFTSHHAISPHAHWPGVHAGTAQGGRQPSWQWGTFPSNDALSGSPRAATLDSSGWTRPVACRLLMQGSMEK